MGIKVSTHSGQLERWLGAEAVKRLTTAMQGWYGPPIALQGVPGAVYATGDGDFIGQITAGEFASSADRFWEITKRITKSEKGGFSSFSDLVAEASGGKTFDFFFQKTGPTGVANVTSSLFRLGAQPVAGSAPAGVTSGTVYTSTSTGGFGQPNVSPDTMHFISAFPMASVAGNTLLLYDLLWGVNKVMASTATETVNGVPTRYQSTTATAADYIGGNFIAVHVGGTQLSATAHTWGGQYTNQVGTANINFPILTGNSAALVDRVDHPITSWFWPLASGDTGIKALNNMFCSASVAAGVVWFMIGHPIAWMPCPIANMVCVQDGLNTAFNLTRIFDGAFLTFLEVIKPSTTATSYTGQIRSAYG